MTFRISKSATEVITANLSLIFEGLKYCNCRKIEIRWLFRNPIVLNDINSIIDDRATSWKSVEDISS